MFWQHEIVCLSCTGQSKLPSPLEKAALINAGLGIKMMEFDPADDSMQFHLNLVDAFPKLKGAGEYELLRSSEHSRQELDVIPPPPGGYTAAFMKAVVSQAKVYV